MCTLCQSASEGSKKLKFFNSFQQKLPLKLQAFFSQFLKRYAAGKSYSFLIFIILVCTGSYFILEGCILKTPQFYLKINGKQKKITLSYLFFDYIPASLKLIINSFYTMQTLTYVFALLANPASQKQYKTDNLLNIQNRQKFCKSCNHTVTRFDHHCIWISNCVAGGNQLYFLLFLASTIYANFGHGLVNIHFLYKIANLQILELNNVSLFQHYKYKCISILFEYYKPVFMQTVAFMIIAAVMVPFTASQLIGVLTNQTTFERLKLQRLIQDIGAKKKILVLKTDKQNYNLKNIKDEDLLVIPANSELQSNFLQIQQKDALQYLKRRNIYKQKLLNNIAESFKLAILKK